MTLVYYPLDENSLLKLVGTTLSTLKKGENCLNQKKKKNEWVGICYVKLEDKRENT